MGLLRSHYHWYLFSRSIMSKLFSVAQITLLSAQPNLPLVLDPAVGLRALFFFFFTGFTHHLSCLLSKSLLWCFILRPRNHPCPWHDPDIHTLYEKGFNFMPAIKTGHWKIYHLRPHNNQAHYFPGPAFGRCSERWRGHKPLLLFWKKRLLSASPLTPCSSLLQESRVIRDM